MSAYGAIAAPAGDGVVLPTLSFPLPGTEEVLVTYPISGAEAPSDLLKLLYGIFVAELESGTSYPQEGPLTYEAFIAYFFGATTIVGIIQPAKESIQPTIAEAKGDERTWEQVTGGCYYIKPNYPGRSSHNCNAGFLVPPTQRGKKLGLTLGRSYLEYAPKLGYRGSVFNLVYKTNVASLRIWDQLGFQRVGLIPKAGRLKTGPNGEEEYVDAVVVWKSFVE